MSCKLCFLMELRQNADIPSCDAQTEEHWLPANIWDNNYYPPVPPKFRHMFDKKVIEFERVQRNLTKKIRSKPGNSPKNSMVEIIQMARNNCKCWVRIGGKSWKPRPENSAEKTRKNYPNAGRSNRKRVNLLQRNIKPDHKHAADKGAARNPHDGAAR